MIEVRHLTKKYGNKTAVDNANFVIQDGEILGFLGPNGAGKSTTMNMLTGYLSSTEGSVSIDRFDILENPHEAKKRIGYLPEHPPLYLDMTVKEYLSFIYELKKVKLPRTAHIEEICRLVKIDNVQKRLIKNLSKGYRQRVGIAQALIGNPDVLILDEPTVGLDPKQIIEIRNLIKHLGKNHTVILSSHILSEVQAICKRVIVINQGKIIADDTPDNLSKNLSKNHSLTVRIVGPERAIIRKLKSMGDVQSVTSMGLREDIAYEFIIDPKEGIDIRQQLFESMAENHWPIILLKSNELTLEEIFLKITDHSYTVENGEKTASKNEVKSNDDARRQAAELAEKTFGKRPVEFGAPDNGEAAAPDETAGDSENDPTEREEN